jgi:ribosome-binding ATPase YchF (GTP1/OBG family)
MRFELGLPTEPGLSRLIHAAYELLGLITFFTADRDTDACARSITRGATAWDAAGKVHREIQEAFVRAEVVRWQDLVSAGGWNGAREEALLRTEGRDYVVADGDVVHIKT